MIYVIFKLTANNLICNISDIMGIFKYMVNNMFRKILPSVSLGMNAGITVDKNESPSGSSQGSEELDERKMRTVR